MLKIGEFSKLSRVSVRMLRYYNDIGLLIPAEIDRFTDYRYYSEEQLPIVCRITALKDMGFSLAEIRDILRIYHNREQLDSYLEARQRALETLAEETTRRLRLLENARERLRKEQTMNYNVNIKTIPERYAACIHTTIPHYEDEGMVWGLLMEETAPLNMRPNDPCLCSVTFLDGEYKEENVELEAQMTVKGTYPDTEHVKFRTLPAVTVASCVYKGGYHLMNEVYTAVISWINANGYQCSGAMFNIYHVSPHETNNPDEYVTEVCYPVVKK